jgi:hypothetical protein
MMASRASGGSLTYPAALLLAGGVVGGGLVALALRGSKRGRVEGEKDSAALSTTSSGHSGAVYETAKAVAEYLQFHFGDDADILPYPAGPHAALNFASR